VTEPAKVHPSAEVEPGVEIGPGTSVWSHVHVRGPSRIGADCIVGEKTYIAYGVDIGDRVKINAMVYVCYGVTIEDGVMIGAGAVFTNDVYPRATTPDLAELRDSAPDEATRHTWVRAGASIGAAAVIGCDLEIGRFAMVGMGATVTRSVPPFRLVVGTPAVSIGCVCRCGEPFVRSKAGTVPEDGEYECPRCGRRYEVRAGDVSELTP
jgi:UDP-2-acetamido-3-amino-2,3-dideoxy-glucuronate N-acetyltransferase